jgi:hypothetical protein
MSDDNVPRTQKAPTLLNDHEALIISVIYGGYLVKTRKAYQSLEVAM